MSIDKNFMGAAENCVDYAEGPTREHVDEVVDRWVKKIGLGFHPDTRGSDYLPSLTPQEVADYDRDMNVLFAFDGDPYEVAIDAWKRAGLV